MTKVVTNISPRYLHGIQKDETEAADLTTVVNNNDQLTTIDTYTDFGTTVVYGTQNTIGLASKDRIPHWRVTDGFVWEVPYFDATGVLQHSSSFTFNPSGNLFTNRPFYVSNRINLSQTDNSSSIAGDFWYDSTRKTHVLNENGIVAYGSGCIYSQTATVTVSNTTAETDLVTTGVGSRTIPANSLVAGRTILVRTKGFMSTSGTQSATIRVKLGSVTLVTNPGNLPSGLNNDGFNSEFMFTIRSTGSPGSGIGQGHTTILVSGVSPTSGRSLTMLTPASINTTVDNTIAVTYQWANASTNNSITVTNVLIEVMA